MPTNARMMVQWDYPLTEADLIPLREALCRELELSIEDDFYSDGPLLIVSDPNRDYDFALSNEQQITAPESYCWLDVNIRSRCYDRWYKRGYFPLFVNIAVWLERQLPGCLLWYGNDCDNILKPFNPVSRADLIACWEQSVANR